MCIIQSASHVNYEERTGYVTNGCEREMNMDGGKGVGKVTVVVVVYVYGRRLFSQTLATECHIQLAAGWQYMSPTVRESKEGK